MLPAATKSGPISRWARTRQASCR